MATVSCLVIKFPTLVNYPFNNFVLVIFISFSNFILQLKFFI